MIFSQNIFSEEATKIKAIIKQRRSCEVLSKRAGSSAYAEKWTKFNVPDMIYAYLSCPIKWSSLC